MAVTKSTVLRVDHGLISQAARAQGLEGATVSHVIKYALALAAGLSNPTAVATTPRGRKPRQAV